MGLYFQHASPLYNHHRPERLRFTRGASGLVTAIDLVASIIEHLEKEPEQRGRPRLPAIEVVATLQFLITQWRGERVGKAS